MLNELLHGIIPHNHVVSGFNGKHVGKGGFSEAFAVVAVRLSQSSRVPDRFKYTAETGARLCGGERLVEVKKELARNTRLKNLGDIPLFIGNCQTIPALCVKMSREIDSYRGDALICGSNIDHANVGVPLGLFSRKGCSAVVDWYRGEDLWQLFINHDGGNTQTFDDACGLVLDIYDQIGSAIAELHSRGILHLDVTLGNIMRRIYANRNALSLIDFGKIRAIGYNVTEVSGNICPNGMEIWEHLMLNVSPETDICMLGIVGALLLMKPTIRRRGAKFVHQLQNAEFARRVESRGLVCSQRYDTDELGDESGDDDETPESEIEMKNGSIMRMWFQSIDDGIIDRNNDVVRLTNLMIRDRLLHTSPASHPDFGAMEKYFAQVSLSANDVSDIANNIVSNGASRRGNGKKLVGTKRFMKNPRDVSPIGDIEPDGDIFAVISSAFTQKQPDYVNASVRNIQWLASGGTMMVMKS